MSGPIAQYDQLLAQARDQLRALRQTVRNLEKKGMNEAEATASVIGMLMQWPQDEVASVLAAAIREDGPQ
jgi:hypothetical protein